MNLFDEDYFEHGVSKGISGYENYHWIPERSYKEAHWFTRIMDVSPADTIIDYGCAKGFFVKAMNDLGYNTYGYDISEYAINNSIIPHKTSDLTKYSINPIHKYSIGFCKDVLEHCPNLQNTLMEMKNICNKWLIVIPLADNGKYEIEEYEKDVTHIHRFTEYGWKLKIKKLFKIEASFHTVIGIKENWAQYENGNLFIITGKK